jgi:hypothetical protein
MARLDWRCDAAIGPGTLQLVLCRVAVWPKTRFGMIDTG